MSTIENILCEMSTSRSDVIDECIAKGKVFTEHFLKLMKDDINGYDFNHHCAEMQTWWDDVKGIRFKNNNKIISNTNLVDWFFTVGQDVVDVVGEKYEDVYNDLIIKMLVDRNKSVKDCVMSIIED